MFQIGWSTIAGIQEANGALQWTQWISLVVVPLVPTRWLKTGPSDPENSETESSSSDNGETGSTSHRLWDSSKGSATDLCWWEMLEKERAEQKARVKWCSLYNYLDIGYLHVSVNPRPLESWGADAMEVRGRMQEYAGCYQDIYFQIFQRAGCLTQVGAIASIFMGGVACRTQMTLMSLTSMWKCWPS